MDQGSTTKSSAFYKLASTFMKFWDMWEGQALPHYTKFHNWRCKIEHMREIFNGSLALNLMNCLKNYKRCIPISYHILNCIQQKKTKFIMKQSYRLVAYPVLSISCLLMLWRLQEPGHQQAWYWSPKPEYSVSSIGRVDPWIKLICFENSRARSQTIIIHSTDLLVSMPRIFWAPCSGNT